MREAAAFMRTAGQAKQFPSEKVIYITIKSQILQLWTSAENANTAEEASDYPPLYGPLVLRGPPKSLPL